MIPSSYKVNDKICKNCDNSFEWSMPCLGTVLTCKAMESPPDRYGYRLLEAETYRERYHDWAMAEAWRNNNRVFEYGACDEWKQISTEKDSPRENLESIYKRWREMRLD